MNKIVVVNLSKKGKGIEKEIERLASKILKFLKKDKIYLEIYLVSSQKLLFLNRKYRSKNKSANVLSFEEPKGFFYPPDTQKRIGEIFLNISAVSDKEKLTLFLIHGILHLFGYQHKKKFDRIKMERIERLLIEKLKN